MLQSPAPALIKMAPPLSGPSMKARSLMVPSCMLNSKSGPRAQEDTNRNDDACAMLMIKGPCPSFKSRKNPMVYNYVLTPANRTVIMQSALTCGIACLCTKRQDFNIFVIGACCQQLPTVAPGHAVDGPFVVFVPLEADDWLLQWT